MQPVSLTRSPELISGTIFTTVQAGYRVLLLPRTTSLQQQALLCTIADGVLTFQTPDAVSLVARYRTAFKRWQL